MHGDREARVATGPCRRRPCRSDVNLRGDLRGRQIGPRDDAGCPGRRYGPPVERSRIAQRWRSVQVKVDWVVALVLTGVGLADEIHTRFAEPLPAAIVATLLTFLPLGLRRRHPVGVLATVATSSLILELALGNPANGKQYSFEVFVAWLVA